MKNTTLGTVIYSFFENHLKAVKGLRASSIKSYRDGLRLFLQYVAHNTGKRISRIGLEDLTFECVREFLLHLETQRGNHVRSRNQRLATLRTFFDYVASREPKMLSVAERVRAFPTKRVAPPETLFLDREQIDTLFKAMRSDSWVHLRDRTLFLLLYNTGARVQEVADLRVDNLDLNPPPVIRLHGKGDKWRTCPLWRETAEHLQRLLSIQKNTCQYDNSIFTSCRGTALTRFGIYKIVRRHTKHLKCNHGSKATYRISPHVFRHTTAVHLLEAGVEINVIRGWLGHQSLDTTNRYAEITIQTKQAALQLCEPPSDIAAFPKKPVWRNDQSMIKWLNSL